MFKNKAMLAWLLVGLIFDIRWIEAFKLISYDVSWTNVWLWMSGFGAALWGMMGMSRLIRWFVDIQESDSFWSSTRSIFHENSMAFHLGATVHYLAALMMSQDAGSLLLAWVCGLLVAVGWWQRGSWRWLLMN